MHPLLYEFKVYRGCNLVVFHVAIDSSYHGPLIDDLPVTNEDVPLIFHRYVSLPGYQEVLHLYIYIIYICSMIFHIFP